ncbi:gibberellin 20 oxidase 2-like [Senna tora]|uniref:Gibberellin 20 oxidase 2-like n=1 Tax=Senna tora TaxID=362788 RepID=A0A834T7P2_9FABA|nr:gibberellin 20 oxidase 2-like [Senna tora]
MDSVSGWERGKSSNLDGWWVESERKFRWPEEYLVEAEGEVEAPIVDLAGFIAGDEEATRAAAALVSQACLSHGFFQVINHGIDSGLMGEALLHSDAFFKLPLHRKLSVGAGTGTGTKGGSLWGYSGAHTHRFSSRLPWKETLSFPFPHTYTNYFSSNIGQDFAHAGVVFHKYCEGMKELGLKLMELLGISLGVDRRHYRDFFEDGKCIMRCNYYPPCQDPSLVLGTGPHSDPTSLTILHQDQVGGLQVFLHNKWRFLPPLPNALLINIGDTFTALSNGRYKSCVHRAVVKRYMERRSLAFFVCPKEDKVVRPPQDLVVRDGTKMYPDFTWSDFLHFTQNHYRADDATLHNFTHWFLSSKPTH